MLTLNDFILQQFLNSQTVTHVTANSVPKDEQDNTGPDTLVKYIPLVSIQAWVTNEEL